MDEHDGDTNPVLRLPEGDDEHPTKPILAIPPETEVGAAVAGMALTVTGEEDACLIDQPHNLIVGGDGMGGYLGGKEAAEFTTNWITAEIAERNPRSYHEFAAIMTERMGPVRDIADHLAEEGMKPEKRGMNTTLAAVQVFNDRIMKRETAGIAWSGDSRVYVMKRRNNRIEAELLTTDDNLAGLLFERYPQLADFVNRTLDTVTRDDQLDETGDLERQFQELLATVPSEQRQLMTERINRAGRRSAGQEYSHPTLRSFFETRNVVTGGISDMNVHVRPYTLQSEDVGFIVTSDGVHDPLDQESINRICTIVLGGQGKPQQLTDTLVQYAGIATGLREKSDDRFAAVWLRPKPPTPPGEPAGT